MTESANGFYIPYGPGWEKEIMKMTKREIVFMLKKACIVRDRATSKLDSLEALLRSK